jgi:hypothetical protein
MTLPPAECKVYTPPLLADAMVRAVGPLRDDYWLDPCMGPGAFIAPLRQHGIPRDRIVGIDIDTSVGKEDGAATIVRGIDFFQWCAHTNLPSQRGLLRRSRSLWWAMKARASRFFWRSISALTDKESSENKRVSPHSD